MYLYNPFYIFSNIVYIIPERQYILIERTCWNTIVRRMFSGNVDSKKTKKLKQIIYFSYLEYMNTGLVNYQKFNSLLSELQGISANPCLFQHIPPTPSVEIALNEESFVEEETYLEDEKIELSAENLELVRSKGPVLNLVQTQITEELNLFTSHSLDHNNLVSLIGYGRIKSLLNQLLCDNKLLLSSSIVFEFFKQNITLLYTVLQFNDPIWYICNECEGINTHISKHPKEMKTIVESGSSIHNQNRIQFYHNNVKIEDLNLKFKVTTSDEVFDGFAYLTQTPFCLLYNDSKVHRIETYYIDLKFDIISYHLTERFKVFNETKYIYIGINCDDRNYCSCCLDQYRQSSFFNEFFSTFLDNGVDSHKFLSKFNFFPFISSGFYFDASLEIKPQQIHNSFMNILRQTVLDRDN